MLQGPYSSLDRDRPLIRLPFTSFAVGTVLLPLTGLVACLFISLMYHFEDSTYTHCQVGRRTPLLLETKVVGLSCASSLWIQSLFVASKMFSRFETHSEDLTVVLEVWRESAVNRL